LPTNGGDTVKFKILLNLGINMRRVGNLEQSVQELRKAIDLQPNKAQAHNNLGLS
jgi:Flp pilus assembly protein TadD